MAKNILIVSPLFYPLFGGMEVQVMLLAKELLKKGCEVDVITEQTKLEFARRENIDGINVIRLKHVGKRDWKAFIQIALGFWLFLFENRDKYQLIIIRTFTFYGLLVGLFKMFLIVKTKTIITAETGGDGDDVATLKNRRFYRVMLFLFNQHDYLNSICDDNFEHLKEAGFDEKKLTRIYNGVDFGNFDKLDYPKEIKTFSFIGRLVPGKGLDELLWAFKEISLNNKVRLRIAGDGSEKQKIIDYINDNKNLDVKYCGYIVGDAKESFFQEVDCIVLPSYTEGFPVSVIEAISKKKVVICSDVSDVKRLFWKNMFICKVKDKIDLKLTMERLLNEYRYGRVNYDDYAKDFSIATVADKFMTLIK